MIVFKMLIFLWVYVTSQLAIYTIDLPLPYSKLSPLLYLISHACKSPLGLLRNRKNCLLILWLLKGIHDLASMQKFGRGRRSDLGNIGEQKRFTYSEWLVDVIFFCSLRICCSWTARSHKHFSAASNSLLPLTFRFSERLCLTI